MSCCPICGQNMDFCAITYRALPFIDGKCYKRMCFCCAHVPQDFVQVLGEDGSVIEEQGPFFDYRHLRSAEELVIVGSAENLAQAGRSLRGVKRAIAKVGVVALKKLKLHQPEHRYMDISARDYDDDDEDDEPKPKRKGRPKEEPPKKPVVQEVIIKKVGAPKKSQFTASKKPRPSGESV